MNEQHKQFSFSFRINKKHPYIASYKNVRFATSHLHFLSAPSAPDRPPASSQCRQLRVRGALTRKPLQYTQRTASAALAGLAGCITPVRLYRLYSCRLPRAQNFQNFWLKIKVRHADRPQWCDHCAHSHQGLCAQRERRPGRDFFISDFLLRGQGYGATMTTLLWLFSPAAVPRLFGPAKGAAAKKLRVELSQSRRVEKWHTPSFRHTFRILFARRRTIEPMCDQY